MLGEFVSLNGQLIPIGEAKIGIDNIEFSYGFAVYENIRLRNNKVYFLQEHLERLMHSAQVIDLEHRFSIEEIREWVRGTVEKNKVESANIKMLLIGGKEPQLYIMLLAPIYPDKKIYKEGVKVTTYNFERFLPQAKTLNMLPSYLAYSEAKKQGAYDALFIDHRGKVAEGTRSNFFVIKNKVLYTPPLEKVLDGVTRRTVIDCAKKNGYKVVEKDLKIVNLSKYDGAFLTNTSGKIVPIKEVHPVKSACGGVALSEGQRLQFNRIKFETICEEIKRLIKLYDEYIEAESS